MDLVRHILQYIGLVTNHKPELDGYILNLDQLNYLVVIHTFVRNLIHTGIGGHFGQDQLYSVSSQQYLLFVVVETHLFLFVFDQITELYQYLICHLFQKYLV